MSDYKRIGDYIRLVDERNKNLEVKTLLGLSISKEFIPSVANTVGSNMRNYKIIRRNQFACSLMQVRRDKKMPVAILKDYEEAIISQAYPVFEVIDEDELLPDYLMMWMSREEFDREACFYAVGGVRGSLEWEDFCNMKLPVPPIEKQQKIVQDYQSINKRIQLNEKLIQKLEESAQAIYKHWFVDFEFPMTKEYAESIGKPELEGKPYKSNGGEMVWEEELGKEVPEGWALVNFGQLIELQMGQSPKGESYNEEKNGIPLINGPVEFGRYFTRRQKWTTSPTKLSKIGDLIVCVRGSTTGRFVKSDGVYCLGRGVCSIRSKYQDFVDLLFKNKIQDLLSLTTGSTFPNWDKETLSSFRVLLPKQNLLFEFCNLVASSSSLIITSNYEIDKLGLLAELLLCKMTKIEDKTIC